MPNVSFFFDFGDPSGTVEEMGCEEFDNAQQIIDAMKKEANGRGVGFIAQHWNMLDCGEVTVTYTPDVPEELRFGDTCSTEDIAKLLEWLHENETVAVWRDYGEPR